MDPEERARLERELADFRKANEGFDAEVGRLRERLALAEARLEALRARRWSRIGEALREARRKPAKLLALPGRIVRILAGPAAAPPKVAAPAPQRSPDGTTLRQRVEAGLVAANGGNAVVAYYPVAARNPYQPLLYGACAEAGIAAVPLWSIEELEDSAQIGAEVWFHIHWTSVVLADASSRRDARRRLDDFTERLDRFRTNGGRIIWTVHNVLPHEFRYPELEIAVCEALAERADQIHVLCAATPEMASPWYDIPAHKVRVLPLCSYLDVYPNTISRNEARGRLGLGEEHLVLAAVGGIRRYKGIEGLLDAFERVQSDRPEYRLVVAGPPINFPEAGELQARCDASGAVTARFGRFPDSDMQVYMNAADVAVLPYDDVLNSSVLVTALGFGRPVIAPRRGCVTERVTSDVGILFDPGVEGDLERALREAPRLRSLSRTVPTKAAAFPPRAMAAEFVRLLREATSAPAR